MPIAVANATSSGETDYQIKLMDQFQGLLPLLLLALATQIPFAKRPQQKSPCLGKSDFLL
jgi:hypothetical protein